MTRSKLPACAVLLAGGRGTRFWPRSRMRTPKQLLNIAGHDTMLRATLRRLQQMLGLKNFWAITNVEQAAAVRREMPGAPASHILAEPLGRNTAAAIGLAAIHLAHERGDAVMAVLPSDSYIANVPRYRKLVRAAIQMAQVSGNLVVMGIPPTRPDTGYGYVESGESARARWELTRLKCDALRRSLHCRWRSVTLLLDATSGMLACFSGASPRFLTR